METEIELKRSSVRTSKDNRFSLHKLAKKRIIREEHKASGDFFNFDSHLPDPPRIKTEHLIANVQWRENREPVERQEKR